MTQQTLADHLVHIPKDKGRRSLCGVVGGNRTGYDPRPATCQDCIELFKQAYPGAWETWGRHDDTKKTVPVA